MALKLSADLHLGPRRATTQNIRNGKESRSRSIRDRILSGIKARKELSCRSQSARRGCQTERL